MHCVGLTPFRRPRFHFGLLAILLAIVNWLLNADARVMSANGLKRDAGEPSLLVCCNRLVFRKASSPRPSPPEEEREKRSGAL